jgi:glycosyltransferase involved in cell wall biosynthesis
MLKLSFILPCYNVAPYIGRCIESIEHQDIPQSEYEVICVDDGSTDDTVRKIKEYQVKYPNIQLICHTENKTAGGARNTGMDAAKGEYLWFVDPDDAIVENVLGNLSKLIERLKVDILFFNYNYIDEEGKAHAIRQFNGEYAMLNGQDFFLTYCEKKRLAEITSVWHEVFSARYIKDNNIRYPEIKSSQDVVFAWHAFLVAQNVTATDMISYDHIRRPSSTTGSKGKYKTKNVISASLLYADEIMQLNQKIMMQQRFHSDLLFGCRDALNTDSRNVFKMLLSEQISFHREIQKYADLINRYENLMDRKTKVIFNYRLPYVIWQLMMWMYMLKNNLKK